MLSWQYIIKSLVDLSWYDLAHREFTVDLYTDGDAKNSNILVIFRDLFIRFDICNCSELYCTQLQLLSGLKSSPKLITIPCIRATSVLENKL